MGQTILELDKIVVGLIVTEDMYPIPQDAVILNNFGTKIWMPTGPNGEVLSVVKGAHMEIELTARDLVGWVGTNPFWSEQPRGSDNFDRMSLKVTENLDAS